ncbi:MAG: hypothetical protein OEY24_03430 [Candidatus Bathyarchaeota archaeon]|nr:hypothetical protein [Candidatus Bathyarchaeota archaeon]MDH5494736.1 hypothetical protein [Candidatus Bathyarchaeota archaeon]
MSEKVLCVLQVAKPAWSRIIHEKLIITPNRTFVVRGWEEHKHAGTYAGSTDIVSLIFGLAEGVSDAHKTAKSKKKMRERERYVNTPEKLLKADKSNFAISNSDINEVRLKKNVFRTISINFFTKDKKKFGWYLKGLNDKTKDVKLEECENILRLIFGDKLSVKK